MDGVWVKVSWETFMWSFVLDSTYLRSQVGS